MQQSPHRILQQSSHHTSVLPLSPQVYTAPEILAAKPYNMKVDVYSFAITLLEIGCRDHRFVVQQFLEYSRVARESLGVAAVTCTGHVGFRPIPKEDFVQEFPELWALVSLHLLISFII